MPNLDYATLYGVETKHVNEQVKRLYFLTSYLPYFFCKCLHYTRSWLAIPQKLLKL